MGLSKAKKTAQAGELSGDEEELVDLTTDLTLHSRRTTRQQKKQQRRKAEEPLHFINRLPLELILNIVSWLLPGDVFQLSRASRPFRDLIVTHETGIATNIIRRRYACLSRCFRPPVLLREVAPSLHPALQSRERQEVLAIHKKPYQHVQPPDPAIVCTCVTCVLRWNSLCLVVDFAHWQPHLDDGVAVRMIPRGTDPAWNRELVERNAHIVDTALDRPLWYAAILQAHLDSTVRSIRRHSQNKGNRRRRFRMTAEDVRAGTDAFLERSGPPSLDFPFHRDNYYMLEAYLPNRGWNGEEGRWMYLPAEQHNRDLEFVGRWAQRRGLDAPMTA